MLFFVLLVGMAAGYGTTPAVAQRKPVLAGRSGRGFGDGKQLGKPVGRMLDKLLCAHRGSMTLVGIEGGASLALGLLKAPPTEHGLKDGTVDRLILLRPTLSAAVVNMQLTKASQSPPSLDVFYESSSALEH